MSTKNVIWVSLERFISCDLSMGLGPLDYGSTAWSGAPAFSGIWLAFPSFDGKNPATIQKKCITVGSQSNFVQKISLLSQFCLELSWGMPCEIGLKSPCEAEIKIVFH